MRVDVPGLLKALGIDATLRSHERWAPCPYPGHEHDGTPSWSIVDEPGADRHGLHHCFGCGASGGVLDLVLDVVGLSGYGAAAAWVRERGLDIDGVAPLDLVLAVRLPKRCRSATLVAPSGLWKGPLATWPTPARRYAEKRGLTAAQVDRWGIACAVDGELEGRVWIPTHDARSRLLDWTARTYCDDEPRYKNVSGGGLPGAIFGELHWPVLADRAQAELVVCEGAFDSLACERVGARYVGGLGGVSRYDRWTAPKVAGWGAITVAVDPDGAGDRVAGLFDFLTRLPTVGRLRRAELPPGTDCDKLWRSDPAELARRLQG